MFMPVSIEIARFKRDFDALAQIGRTSQGGASRLAFSQEEAAGRDFVKNLMKDANLSVWIDPAGNIHGRRKGRKEGAVVATGSHSDTVENGGHYDGVVGVLGAIEVMRSFNDAGIETGRDLEVIAFAAEETNDFGLSCFGSKALAGEIDREMIFGRCDSRGNLLVDTLGSFGVSAEGILSINPDDYRMHAFIELHVEQGRVLYDAKIPVGLVTDIVGAYRYRATFIGMASHSGATPMNVRKDALAAAAEGILAVETVCRRYQERDIVGTVGVISVSPGVINVIPGRCEIIFEVRGRVGFPKTQPVAEIKAALSEIAARRGIDVQVETLMEDESHPVSANVLDALKKNAEEMGIEFMFMPSRTGHDAAHLAGLADIGMIFLPSHNGIGHNPEEFTELTDIETGLRLLAATLFRLADF
jgi:N-carbamoyl-L-amino-acid hydrolase